MKTYQDWLKVADKDENQRMAFIKSAINTYKGSRIFEDACYGEDYFNGANTTIKQFEKILFNAQGEAVRDMFSANHKLANRFFYRDVMQVTSTLLGNGITWAEDKGGDALGKDFDRRIIEASNYAQQAGVSYGFFNNGRVDVFRATEFMPFIDEEDGALKTGVRFWQIDSSKPLRATLYELDGYTEYIWNKEQPAGAVLHEKRPYIIYKLASVADGEEIYDFKNYPTFPIVPLYANGVKQSELLPIRATIDAYDLINSGYANDIDDANIIYWTITNAGGMNDIDLVQFLDKMRKMHAAQLDDDQVVTPHTVDVPYNGREAILDRLEKQLYKDAMALNTYDLASGAVTATQIEAAYEPLNEKLDAFEAQVTEFISGLLLVAGVEDEPTYSRSIMINRSEEVQTVISAANYLDEQYITEKVLTILGDKDKVDEVLEQMEVLNYERLQTGTIQQGQPPEDEQGGAIE